MTLTLNDQARIEGEEIALAARRIQQDREAIGVPIGLVEATNMAAAARRARSPVASAQAMMELEGTVSAVAAAIVAGKVLERDRSWAMNFCRTDFAGFAAFVASAPLLDSRDDIEGIACSGPAIAANLPSAESGTVWIKLMPAGTFETRDGRGPHSTGDKAQMQSIVTASLKYAGSTDLVIDYDHQTVFGAVPGVGGQAPAAGWIKQLEARGDGIYGRVHWTAAAAQKIKAGEYRYLSPFYFAHKGSGRVWRLGNVALTNTPALDSLTAVAAGATVRWVTPR